VQVTGLVFLLAGGGKSWESQDLWDLWEKSMLGSQRSRGRGSASLSHCLLPIGPIRPIGPIPIPPFLDRGRCDGYLVTASERGKSLEPEPSTREVRP